ncbi:MAG: tetratricopeptide repeat protein [Acidobacteriota bacterium]
MRPLILALVVMAAVAFCAATVFANRFYQSTQLRLGKMWFGRGEAALAAGQPQAAIQDFRNTLYYSHDNPGYQLRLAEALLAANRIPEAQSYLLALWQNEPSNSTVNLQLARLSARQGRTQAALRYYHGAIYGLWPDGAATARRQQTRLELIHYLLGLQDATQADGELIALIPELPRRAAPHIEVGVLLLQAGDQDRSLQEFEEALRLNPKDSAALQGAGEAAFQGARYGEAAQYLERAVRGGQHDPKAEELLATSRLVLEWNPYAMGLSSRQRAARIVQAFRQASRRLQQCAAMRDIILTPGPAAAGGTEPNPADAPGRPQSRSGLVAKIFRKIEPGKSATPAPPASSQLDAGKLQQLQQQIAQLSRKVRTYRLERDPQLGDLAMELVTEIESVTAQECGPPTGADLALLLLAHQAEER